MAFGPALRPEPQNQPEKDATQPQEAIQPKDTNPQARSQVQQGFENWGAIKGSFAPGEAASSQLPQFEIAFGQERDAAAMEKAQDPRASEYTPRQRDQLDRAHNGGHNLGDRASDRKPESQEEMRYRMDHNGHSSDDRPADGRPKTQQEMFDMYHNNGRPLNETGA